MASTSTHELLAAAAPPPTPGLLAEGSLRGAREGSLAGGELDPSGAPLPRCSRRGALALFGLGAGLAWLRSAPLSRAAPSAGVTRWWATDRAAGLLWSLDKDFLLLGAVHLRSPTELEPARGGGVWVLSQRGSISLGPHRLLLLAGDGEVRGRWEFGAARALCAVDEGVLLIEWGAGSSDRLWFIQEGQAPVLLFQAAGLVSAAASDRAVLVGGSSGEVWLLERSLAGARLATVELPGGEISDVARGPRPGQWWVLDVSGGARLLLLDARLGTVFATDVGLAAGYVVPVPGEERAWVADLGEPRARRFGPGGVLELDVDVPLAGLGRGLGRPGGGAVYVAPGALLHLDASGQLAPGQGGFDFLIDLARVD